MTTLNTPDPPAPTAPAGQVAPVGTALSGGPSGAPSCAPSGGSRWTGGRVASVAIGGFLLLCSIGLLVSSVVISMIDDGWREDGYLTSDQIPLSTSGYAIATERIDLEDVGPFWPDIDRLLGDVRLRATSQTGDPVFLGIADTDDAADYLEGVQHATLTEIADPATEYTEHAGQAPARDPSETDIWVGHAEGTGTQSLSWPVGEGTWTVVVMNADGSPGVDVAVDIGATVPVQEQAGRWLMIGAAPVAILGSVLVLVPVYRTRRGTR